MSATTYTDVQDETGGRDRLHLIGALLLAALLLLLPLLFRIGPGSWRTCAGAQTVAAAPALPQPAAPPPETAPQTPAAAAPAVEPSPEPVSVAPPTPAPAPPPAARVYFEVNRTNLPGEVETRLAEIVAYLKANPGARAEISGFHDPRGKAARNKTLAEGRAVNVRKYLADAGIAEDRLSLKEPAETTGTGDYNEARRVEVSIAP